MTPEERRLRNQHAAHSGWANTRDRTARTAPGRRKFQESFLEGLDPSIPLDARLKMAESARKAHYARMAANSLKARNAKKAAARKQAANGDGAPVRKERRRTRTELTAPPAESATRQRRRSRGA
jgi:hypothetical protein